MIDFLTKAWVSCDDIDKKYDTVKTKFTNVLQYFGEESAMPSSDFFSTLSKFVKEFTDMRLFFNNIYF